MKLLEMRQIILLLMKKKMLSFQNEEDRTSFLKYYVTTVEIKDFNVLIDQKIDIPVKNREEIIEKLLK